MDFSLDAAAFALPLGFLFFVGIMIVRKASLRRRDAVLTLFVTYLASIIENHSSAAGRAVCCV